MSSFTVAQALVANESDGKVEEDRELEYPVPMSPFAGELSKEVELQRALVAEAAMKSGPAIGRESVLFEDEWIMIVNKPRGLYCEHVFATVPSLLSSSGESQAQLHMANRLDRDTSGIMVITKCREAAAKLTRAFTNREVNKTYLAQCVRAQRMWRKTRIESGHGRSRYGAWRVYAKHDVGRRLPGGSAVRDMVTRVEILAGTDLVKQDVQPDGDCEWVEVVVGSEDEVKLVAEGSWDDEAQGVTVVRAFPETGRTHQIRLHCQYLGLPLCGDVKYGGPLEWQGVRYDSHALHAESLTFSHPITKELLTLVAPCPTWAAQLGVKPFQFKDS
jgi:23S rRNA-/tRNA-specific pseudouridylate synthase